MILNQFTSMLMGPHEESRDTVITLANGTYPYGTVLALDTSTSKYVVFVIGGVTNGNGIPATILMEPDGIVKTGGTGDVTGKLRLIAGKVLKSKLLMSGGTYVDLTPIHIRALHDNGIVVVDALELSGTNNYTTGNAV